MNWNTWLKENLRPDQYDSLNAYDVEILSRMYNRLKRLAERMDPNLQHLHLHVEASTIFTHIRMEMGGLTAVEFDEHIRKLCDMSLIRTQIVFNREMPEDIGKE